MANIATFDRLMKKLDESSPLKINKEGEKLLAKYNTLMQNIELELSKLLNEYLLKPDQFKKELAVHIISDINARQLGNEEFKIMSSLYNLTNNGKSIINPSSITFNQNDKILNYLEKTN
jgi:hypothetical protein